MSIVHWAEGSDSTYHFGNPDVYSSDADSDCFPDMLPEPPAWEITERVIPKLPTTEPRYFHCNYTLCKYRMPSSARSGLVRFELRIKRGLSHEHVCYMCNLCYTALVRPPNPAFWTIYTYGKCLSGSNCKLCHE
jgi:hypothetical protein